MASSSRTSADFFFGWDLLYNSIQSSINKKADVLVALAHFMLIRDSKFQCIGVGEDKSLTGEEVGSELLPEGWNDDDSKYALRYTSNDKKLYLMLSLLSDDFLIINFVDVKDKKVSNIGLYPEALVACTKGPISTIMPEINSLADRFRKEMIEPVSAGFNREVTTQTTSSEDRAHPMRISDPLRPIGQFVPANHLPPHPPPQRPFGFPEVGRGDLDPLGRGGPGNLFPFPSNPELPRGNLQPRFDPFGPPERNVPGQPNPDHMHPPNFGGHDYFM